MKGIKYNMAIATSGVISNIPSLGINRLNGDRIGPVTSSNKSTNILCLLIVNQEKMALIKTINVNIWQR